MRKRITISDHAIVRWIERAAAFDLNFVREQIKADTAAALNAGLRKVPDGKGNVYVLDARKRTVITILPGQRADNVPPGRLRKRSPRDFREENDE